MTTTTDLVQKKIKMFDELIDENWGRHYCLRRLPIMGAALFVPALLAILFSYLSIPKDKTFNISAFDWVYAIGQPTHIVIYIVYIALMLLILCFIFTERGESVKEMMKINGFIAMIASPPLILFPINISHGIMFAFIWGVMLTLLSWQINSTFGYTRIWARSKHYLRLFPIIDNEKSAGLLSEQEANSKRIALLLSLEKEIYTDTVGDTFHLWERITRG